MEQMFTESKERIKRTLTINNVVISLDSIPENADMVGIDLSIAKSVQFSKGSLKPAILLSVNFRNSNGDDFDQSRVFGMEDVQDSADFFAKKYSLDDGQAKLLKDEMVQSFLDASR